MEVLLNDVSISARQFNDFTKDVVWQVELTQDLQPFENLIELNYQGVGSLSWQVAPVHYVPWETGATPDSPLSIEVQLDTTSVAVNDVVTVSVTVTNTDPSMEGKMAMISVGIPAGFSVISQDLQAAKAAGLIEEFDFTGRQVLLYISTLPANQPLTIQYGMLAEMPVTSQGAEAETYFYYAKELSASAPATSFDVTDPDGK